MAEDEVGGHDALTEHVLRSVEIGDQGVEHPSPLIGPDLEPRPVGTGDHERNRIEHPGPLLPRLLILHRVGDAVVADQPAGLFPAVGEFGRLPGSQLVDQPAPMGPRVAVGTPEFVVAGFRRPVARKRIGRCLAH